MPMDRILVVEDEPLFREFMREVLSRRNVQPVMADTLAQAEALARVFAVAILVVAAWVVVRTTLGL